MQDKRILTRHRITESDRGRITAKINLAGKWTDIELENISLAGFKCLIPEDTAASITPNAVPAFEMRLDNGKEVVATGQLVRKDKVDDRYEMAFYLFFGNQEHQRIMHDYLVSWQD